MNQDMTKCLGVWFYTERQGLSSLYITLPTLVTPHNFICLKLEHRRT